jgi:hypothetical protein
MGIKLPTQGVGWESLIVIKQEARFKPLPMPKMHSDEGQGSRVLQWVIGYIPVLGSSLIFQMTARSV